ncbi:hypothetical protein LPJ72_004684, partial [Coemansia sp. Benny D160-2]
MPRMPALTHCVHWETKAEQAVEKTDESLGMAVPRHSRGPRNTSIRQHGEEPASWDQAEQIVLRSGCVSEAERQGLQGSKRQRLLAQS